ncbi:putative amidohydrolase [Colletotrichum scovillei]|uniref:Amidohydrolase n=1 Tax=Colletotrichum scovillei TaxID=1209932 RepID=A0A9P7UCA1_9PEZI|nr:putative amidohydrolase [Colletotrichum scovillei]KAF4784660.1 putative amidohydrolase [Colletotrichum scovillei]KAG7040105.1 amidohydrolase [Colletotrichum scovillei]KAG7042282.1 amidohydrolase [Colletotrichum scovillei]KAG7062313.1 amidohydrolase [Colletotrichum scovillei]
MTRVLIKNVCVFDGDVIQNTGNILFTRSAGNIQDPMIDDSQFENPDHVIDGRGCTLIPGLIDAYVNIKGINTALDIFASHGVTTVIDLSSNTEQCQSLRVYAAGKTKLPTVLCSGTEAVPMETHRPDLRGNSDTVAIRTREDAVAFVSAKSSGPDRADLVKVAVSLHSHSDEILKTIVDVAHAYDKLAVARTTGKASYERGMRAGFDIFAHAPLDAPIDAAMAGEMAAQGKIFIPTLTMAKKQTPSEQSSFDLVTPGATVGNNYDNATESVRTLHEAGVTICAGTTANVVPGAQVSFGESLHEELCLLVEAGMPTLDVLRSATCVASKAFSLGDRGNLRGGCRADLVLVEGNPFEDISVTRKLKGVWIQGEYICTRQISA